ncbi:MAG: UDP-2,4-diacetamido-2,4,6-trideoxy-beta-L-altropyranose hydrolase [Lutisporaceae bacterium]
MKILIRADGGYNIGMGHVMRMLVLADRLKDFSEVVFVCRKNGEFETGVSLIEAYGYPVFTVNGEAIIDQLAGIGGDCLITDSYDADESYFKCTRDIFSITGYMDDLNKVRINADFIINQNIYAQDLGYEKYEGTLLLLGTQYALLRDEFRGLPARKTRRDVESVLVTLGGSDPQNLTEKIALKLGRAFPGITFHVTVGPSFINGDSLEAVEGENILIHREPKMSALMMQCDAAVSACGSTVYELCACGTPVIGIAAANNQIMTARKMSSIGALIQAEGTDDVIDCLRSLDYGVRVRMSETARKLVDGNGSIRASEQIRKIICKK